MSCSSQSFPINLSKEWKSLIFITKQIKSFHPQPMKALISKRWQLSTSWDSLRRIVRRCDVWGLGDTFTLFADWIYPKYCNIFTVTIFGGMLRNNQPDKHTSHLSHIAGDERRDGQKQNEIPVREKLFDNFTWLVLWTDRKAHTRRECTKRTKLRGPLWLDFAVTEKKEKPGKMKY